MQTESTYRLTPGTTVVIEGEDGNYRHTVEQFEEIDFILEHVSGVSHSTMNGGGFDHVGRCPITGEKMRVRTTLARPAHTTFAPVAS